MADTIPSLPGLDADILSALGIAIVTGSASPEHANPFAGLPPCLVPLSETPTDEPLIEALRREFDRAVADPSQLLGMGDWPAHAARHRERAPDFHALGALAAPLVHLRDLVLPPLSVDHCIRSFDSDGPAEPPQLPVPTEVLRLFAPDAPAADRPAGLPGATRQDHHLLTTDTAMVPGRFSTPTPEARHDPDAAPA